MYMYTDTDSFLDDRPHRLLYNLTTLALELEPRVVSERARERGADEMSGKSLRRGISLLTDSPGGPSWQIPREGISR